MKLNSQSDQWRVTSDEYSAPTSRGARRATGHSSLITHHSRRGIALVITLIMLSVTLVMAVAFLAIARRERGSVTTTTDTTTARLAAETALAGAEAQIVANILTTNSAAYDFGLLVSTNYINAYGFISGISNPTNVNYTYGNGVPLNDNSPNYDQMQNIANLWFLPRAPVFVTNRVTATNDFRFYLDLNRNTNYDANGTVTNYDSFGNILLNSAGNPLVTFQVGDPEWVGILEHPDQPHGPNNHFIARYAFFAQPIGNSLDFNYIHDQVKSANLGNPFSSANDGYFRNEGVGSWEINFASFLADLNTNEWGQFVGSGASAPTSADLYYQYNEPANNNAGAAFADAQTLLAWRYGYNYNLLATPTLPFYASLVKAGIDGYTSGNLMTNTFLPFVLNPLSQHWAGSDNTNRFFALPSDMFDQSKTAIGLSAVSIASGNYFSGRLAAAGTNTHGGTTISTYDRYTFYRMLSQIGSDSLPESGKLNLNYRNVTNGVIVAGMQTNLYPWTALEFFTNAADRMLRLYTTNWFSTSTAFVTNINPANVTNVFFTGPSNYLAAYYGVHTNYFSYIDPQGYYIWNAPNGFGLTNIPFVGVTNQIPGFGLTSIPVFVNSNVVYSSAVNRVLQLAANLFDASTNSRLPSVFRPTFWVTNQLGYHNVYINGYQQVYSVIGANDNYLNQPTNIAGLPFGSSTVNFAAFNGVNVYGVPWIIGAKKGLPNFNEFSMENNLSITRRLQFTRSATNSATPPVNFSTFKTNQMYMMNLNSLLGIELWNSYTNSYPDPVLIAYRENASLTITNDEAGFEGNPNSGSAPMFFSTNFQGTLNFWPGTGANWLAGNPNGGSFVVPLNASMMVMTNAIYRTKSAPLTPGTVPSGLTAPCFVSTNYLGALGMPVLYETNTPGFPFPQFGLLLTNQLQVFILDLTNGVYHVIDYVHFAGPNSAFNVNSNLADLDNAGNNFGTGVWDTNYTPGSLAPTGLTYGILNQTAVSKNGSPPAEDGIWRADPEAVPQGGTTAQQQAHFSAFFMPGNKTLTPVAATNSLLSVQAPYSPTRYVVQYITWQANDPLVHYLASDIDYSFSANSSSTPQPGVHHYNAGQIFSPLTSLNLGLMNDRYSPWGGNPHFAAEGSALQFDTNIYNLSERDSLVVNSSSWDFPTNKYPTVGWIGRVHRGTPWQTVFLKATNVLAMNNGFNIWEGWTGDYNQFDAINSAPNQDAELFDVFTAALNDNATRGTLSVNQNHLAAWSALLSGLPVPTSTTNSFTIIDPVGATGTNSPLWQLINYTTNGYPGITSTRANPTYFPFGVFTHEGDIVRVPTFSDHSPFLAGHDLNYISDEVYEWLPQQTLGLLRLGTPRFVIYGYGQTLKPAPNGVVTSGGANFFGLVTNYQVTAENALRAVVSVHPHVTATSTGFVTNYTTTVESYNPLPPN
jgi:hypothetical protein